jgi:hypothetical protein
LNAGTGITTSGTYPNFTITNSDRGSSQNIFKNIAVSGQSTIVADSNDDTLTIASGTGISLTTNATSDTLTITNTLPDQTVVLTAGTGISTSGTYPNFTITNTLPDQTVVLTGAGTTVVTGTYPSFTITSNDQYVGTVTSVATSAPITGGTITTTGTIGITQSTTSSDGYLSSTDWNTFNSKVGGSGTTNYVAKFTGSGTIGNSQIFDNGTNVGIGTVTPAEKLQVNGLVRITNSTFAGIEYHNTNGTWELYLGTENGGSGARYNSASSQHTFYNNGSAVMRINSSGNVGIGTTSPSYKLDVIGTGGFSGNVTSGGKITSGIGAFRTGGFYIPYAGSTNSRTWAMTSDEIVYGDFSILTSSTQTGGIDLYRFYINPAGNVGIGTTAPAKLLSVRSLDNAVTSFAGFYALNETQGVELWYGGIQMAGSNSNVALSLASKGAESIVFNTNSSEKMRITAAGNVGIGITSPANKLIAASDASPTSENSYAIAAAAASDPAYKTVIGYDFTNDVGLIAAVRTGIGWRNISMPQGSLGLGVSSPTQKLHVAGNIRVTGAYYDSNNEAGTSGQVLTSTVTGTDWMTPATTTATSLYDLLPAARVAYNWTGQVVNDTWVDIFSAANNILTTGTWMVQMYISDWAQGGQHYTYTYAGTMQWYQETVNQGGESAASEIYLHRMGHAANANVLYLRTTEMTAGSGGIGKLQIKANYSNTSNTTINFKFVKIF